MQDVSTCGCVAGSASDGKRSTLMGAKARLRVWGLGLRA